MCVVLAGKAWSSPFSLLLRSSSASWVCRWVWLALRQQFISCSSFSSWLSFAARVPSWAHLNMPEQRSWAPPQSGEAQEKQQGVSVGLLFLQALLLFGYFWDPLLQVVAALQGLLKFRLHVVHLEGQSEQNDTLDECCSNIINPCAVFIPPRLPPSPGERSYSPSKSFETPADSSAGTSTVDADKGPDHYCAGSYSLSKFLPLVEGHQSSRHRRCPPHIHTARSSHQSCWPPADARSYLVPQRSITQMHF